MAGGRQGGEDPQISKHGYGTSTVGMAYEGKSDVYIVHIHKT